MVSKGPIFDREMALVLMTLSRPFDEDDDTLWRPTINDPLDKADSPVRHRQECVSNWRRLTARLCWVLVVGALLILSAGCAPAIDENVRLAGIGTARAAPERNLIPHFSGAVFVAADGEALPLRKWLPPSDRDGGEVRAVILALHGFNDYGN